MIVTLKMVYLTGPFWLCFILMFKCATILDLQQLECCLCWLKMTKQAWSPWHPSIRTQCLHCGVVLSRWNAQTMPLKKIHSESKGLVFQKNNNQVELWVIQAFWFSFICLPHFLTLSSFLNPKNKRNVGLSWRK